MSNKLTKNQLIGILLINLSGLCTALMYSDLNRAILFVSIFIFIHSVFYFLFVRGKDII